MVEAPAVVVEPYYPDQYYVYGGYYYYWDPRHEYYVRLRQPPRGANIRYSRVERLPPPPHGAPRPGPRPPVEPGPRP